jgi:ribosome assembly protein RRB1
MDWSLVKTGVLATGDNNGSIQVWSPRPDGAYALTPLYDNNAGRLSSSSSLAVVDNHGSVEDLQWSPSEETVVAAAHGGGYVRIYDTRASQRAMLSHSIHQHAKNSNMSSSSSSSSAASDVNVLSWNKLVTNLIATGGDDGVLAVWDLRQFASGGTGSDSSSNSITPLARFTPHRTPITTPRTNPC